MLDNFQTNTGNYSCEMLHGRVTCTVYNYSSIVNWGVNEEKHCIKDKLCYVHNIFMYILFCDMLQFLTYNLSTVMYPVHWAYQSLLTINHIL